MLERDIVATGMYCCVLQTSDPVINTENDEKLMLKADLSLLENGVGQFEMIFPIYFSHIIKYHLPVTHVGDSRNRIQICFDPVNWMT